MTTRQELSEQTHRQTWRGLLSDPSWLGNSPMPLDIIDVSWDQQYDRVPSTRITIRISPPFDDDGNSQLHWISPLHMTATVELWTTYDDEPELYLGRFQLRRRRLQWPMAGGVTLDCASWDGDAADRVSDYELIANATGGG